MRKSFSRVVAFILLLVFFQKSCAVLWLHDWLHVNNASYAKTSGKTTNVEQARCTCLDDFFLPFTHAGQHVPALSSPVYACHAEKKPEYFISIQRLFYCLRAPPVSVS